MARTKQIASKFIEQSTRYHQPNPESAEAVIVISDDEEQAEEEKDNLFQNSQNVQPQQEEQPQQRQRQQRQQQHHHRESEEEDENEDLQQNEQDSQVGVNRANKSAVCAAISSSVSRLLPQVDDVIVDDASNQRIVLLHQQTLLSSDDVYCWILQGKGKQTAASSGSTSTSNTYFRRESFSSSSSSSKRPRITPPDFEMNRLSLENIFTFLSTPPSHTTPTSTNELDNNDAPLIMVGKALIKFPTSLADGPDCPDGQRLLVTSTTYFHDGDRKPVVNSLLFWAAISLSSKKFLFEIASVISPESLPSPARRFVHLAVNALNDGYTAEAVWDNSSLSVTVSFYTSTVINQSVSEKKFAASDRFNLFVFLKGSSRSSSPTQYSRRLYLPEKYRMDENDELLQPDSLQPTLMKYQRRALAWMLEREGVLDSDLPLFLTSSRVDRQPPHIWQCGLPDGSIMHVDLLKKTISSTPITSGFLDIRGGILAEETGLGKTVEMIALILSNPIQVEETFIPLFTCECLEKLIPPTVCGFCKTPICSSCEACPNECTLDEQESPTNLIFSAATLIITPRTILNQWFEEFARHAPHLRVHHYDGMKNLLATRSKGKSVMSEQRLASRDIVITTYDVMNTEIHRARPARSGSLRHEKIYKIELSHIMKICWWRVCLDEVQMVDTAGNSSSGKAEMARIIHRVNSWGVSGTPMTGGYEELKGMLRFLRLEPLAKDWKQLCNLSTVPHQLPLLMDVVKTFLHRNMKFNVQDEIDIPTQNEKTFHLKFSKVEAHRYSSLVDEFKEELAVISRKAARSGNLQISARDKQAAMRKWMLRLRQTCCHPQVGSSNKQDLGREFKSMGEVLQTMYRQCRSQALTLERTLVTLEVEKGQLNEFIDRHEDACQLYERCLTVVDKQLAVLGKYYADAKQDAENFKASLGADFKEEEEDLNNNKDEDDDDNNNMGLDNDARAAAIAKLADLRALISQFANNLTSWKELKHQIAFFIACAAHKLEDKNKEERFYEVAADIRKELLKPFTSQNVEVTATFVKETQKFIKDIYDIDDEEDDGNNGRKVPKMDSSAMTKTDGKGMLLPAFNKFTGGLRTRPLFDQVRDLVEKLNKQWLEIEGLRNELIQVLLSGFQEDDNDAEEATGEEYEQGLKMQELGTALENVYKHALGDRNELLTGVRFGNDILLNPAAKEVELLAKFTPYAPERRKPLTKDRSAARRKGMYKEDGSEDEEEDGEEDAWMERLKNNEGIPCLKKFVIKLNRLQADQRDEIDQLNAKRVREIATFRAKVEARRGQKDYDLLAKELERVERSSAQEAASDWRIRDSSMARQAAEFLRKELDRQLKKIGILKKEEETFTKLANSRIEYFRFLQKLSDEVVEHEPVDNPRDEIQNIVAEIDKTKTRIVQAEGRRRYLQTLMEEEKQGSGASSTTIDEVAAATASAARAQSERECGICKMGYTKGFLLPCAHAYCEVCTKAWITVHRKCPLCNEPATAQTLTPVSFQMIQPLSGLLQTSSLSASQYIAASSRRQEEETADETFLKDLAKIRIDRSYGVKFDTILRHVIHLRGKDPAAKVLIFSQWQQVLAILKKAFSQNGLRYVDLDSSVSKKDAVSRFTKDTNISAFFLHATSQSQGLTLVVAKHVFLCEPTIHAGIELQAINRVHRIGQKTSTHVYRYLIEDTIEERIVQRRNLNRSTINKKFKVLSGAVGEAVDEDDLNYVMSPYIED